MSIRCPALCWVGIVAWRSSRRRAAASALPVAVSRSCSSSLVSAADLAASVWLKIAVGLPHVAQVAVQLPGEGVSCSEVLRRWLVGVGNDLLALNLHCQRLAVCVEGSEHGAGCGQDFGIETHALEGVGDLLIVWSVWSGFHRTRNRRDDLGGNEIGKGLAGDRSAPPQRPPSAQHLTVETLRRADAAL